MRSDSPATKTDSASALKTGEAVHPDPYKWRAVGLIALFTLTLPAILSVLVFARPAPPVRAWSVEAASLGVDPYEIERGAATYQNTCAVCHGPNGEGVPRLGKPVRNSAFVQAQSDEELFQLLVEGRPIAHPLNTSGALMPPRGAQGLSDESLSRVVLYLRAIQDPDAPTVSTAAWDLKSEEGGEAAVTAIELTEHSGYDLFVSSCAACHGQGGEGIDDLGLPLTTSGFVRSQSDKDLITFIKMGRPMWDPNNTTGLDMPPKGGNPAITDQELQTIVDYMRALQDKAMSS